MFATISKLRAGLILAAIFLPGLASLAAAQEATPKKAPAPAPAFGADVRARMNTWTIGLAAGQPEGAPLRYAAELARAFEDGDEMRVIPMVTHGAPDNLKDLLFLRGVDAAIINGDALGELSNQPDVLRKVNYIANLFPAEVHIVARPEIKTLEDLNGKTVNFNSKGTAAAYTGPIIFDKLQLKVTKTFMPHPLAVKQMMERGDIAAVMLVSSKPLDAFAGKKFPAGFHFLPVPYSIKLGQYYMPSTLKDTDYPELIAKGEQVSTIAVPVVLAAFDWPKGSDRYRRMERFAQYWFVKLPILQSQPGYHPKWKDVNPAGKVPGWNRFPPVQAELDKLSTLESQNRFRAQTAKALPNNPAEQERLFQDFMRWSKDPAMQGQARKTP